NAHQRRVAAKRHLHAAAAFQGEILSHINPLSPWTRSATFDTHSSFAQRLTELHASAQERSRAASSSMRRKTDLARERY
ncbi:MAG: hypothetical protein AAGK78_13290, partial [Planctomycetota bacterium]